MSALASLPIEEAERIRAHAERVVATFEPLTAEQLTLLADLLVPDETPLPLPEIPPLGESA